MLIKPSFLLLISLFILLIHFIKTTSTLSPNIPPKNITTFIDFPPIKYPTIPTRKIPKRALQKDHEKPQAEKWMDSFFGRNLNFDQLPSLVNLITVITKDFLTGCTSIILYDSVVEQGDGLLLEQLFRYYPIPFVHGQITSQYTIKHPKVLKNTGNQCVSYILFLADVMKASSVIGDQRENKVVIVSRSSQWRVYEFLASELSRVFVNLLVIQKSEKIQYAGLESAYILYTHKMYVDGIGSSEPIVLNSWKQSNFTRKLNLFPMKMTEGFAGHRFIVGVAHQPPFVVKQTSRSGDVIAWDGVEIRMLQLLSEQYNFTTDIRESRKVDYHGSGNAVTDEVASKRAQIGIGGVYVTQERYAVVDMSQSHSQDCAAFITLSSTALPRYRAIFGPFHWSVWLCITFIYLFAIFPLVLSDKQTLAPLLKNPEEMENMFWYMFGTFTNAFTFKGKASWAQSEKVTTRVLVGFYWIFTIITTSCYTGSIIAFVTLPIVPQTVDTTEELVRGRYKLGTLDRGGWEYWFANSTDRNTDNLFKSIEFLPNVQAGLRNVTRAFFWSYAFLGSRDELDFIIKSNFTMQSRRNVLHISDRCFVPYGVAFLFPMNSIYQNTINRGLLNVVQSGFIQKLKSDVEFDLMRSSTGKLLSANVGGKMHVLIENRALSLDDTQGMFLLLGAGFLVGAFLLLSEWLGGCVTFCKKKIRRMSTVSIQSNHRSHDTPTPREKVGSLQYSIHTRMHSFSDGPTAEVDEEEIDDKPRNGVCLGIAPEILTHHRLDNGIDEVHTPETNETKNVKEFNEENKEREHVLTQNCHEEFNDDLNEELKFLEEDSLGDKLVIEEDGKLESDITLTPDYDQEIDKAFDLDDVLFGEIRINDNVNVNDPDAEELNYEPQTKHIAFTN